MHNLLTRLFPKILQAAKEKRGLLIDYVTPFINKSKKIAIVDIGWHGNMQGSLSRLLQLRQGDIEFAGLYIGTFDHVKDNYLPRNIFCGYLVEEGYPQDRKEAFWSGGSEILEFALMADHGTTLDYERQGDKIIPILEANTEDQQIRSYAQALQRGAMAFIEAGVPLLQAIGAEGLNSPAWADPFFRLVRRPTVEEADLFGELTHSDVAANTLNRIPLAIKLDPSLARAKGKAYAQAYEKSYWKAGFRVRNG